MGEKYVRGLGERMGREDPQWKVGQESRVSDIK